MKKYFLFYLFLNVFSLSYSQNNQLEDLHNVFAPLDKTKISTGILSDYGVQLVSFTPFNGVLSDSSYTNFDVWQMLYAGLYSSVIRSDVQLESVNDLVQRLKSTFAGSPSTVYLPVINFNYATLNPEAATLGLISIQNEQLYDIPNKNPYQLKSLFAAAPSRSHARGSSIPFSFRSEMHLTNLTATVTRIDVDFGNGLGYKRAYFNTPYNAPYTTSGEVTVKVKFTLSNGERLYSHFKMNIEVPPSPAPAAYPSHTIDPKSGVHSGGKLSWRFSSKNTSGKILQPLIVAEGFDPLAILFNRNFSLDNFIYSLRIGVENSTTNFLNNLDVSKYDIVFLDYNDGIDDIFRNAKLLEEAIEWVNGQKGGMPGAQPNVVMGLSMGGLVAKTALRSMEVANKNHDTRLFVSVDSPHKGANVPVGFQALVMHMDEIGLELGIPGVGFVEVYDPSERIDLIKRMLQVFRSTAAKQMLKYRVGLNNSNLEYQNTDHLNFLQQYESTGFPTQCRNVAVSNGSISGQSLFQPGSALFDFYQKKHLNFWLSYFIGSSYSWLSLFTNYPEFADFPLISYNSDIIIDLNINAIPNRQVASVYDGRIAVKKRILFFITKEINLTHQSLTSTSDMLPFDGSPGGSSSIDVSSAQGLSADYRALLLGAIKQPDFTFIPVSSSLAVNTTNPLERLDNQNLISSGRTPFASYFAQHYNEDHQQFSPSNARYILNELAGVTCPPPFGSTMSGPTKFCLDGEYVVNYYGTCATYTWTASSNLKIIDGQGTSKAKFRMVTPGTSWVNAYIQNPSGSLNVRTSNIVAGIVKPSIVGPFDASTNAIMADVCINKPHYYLVYPVTSGVSNYRWWLYGEDFPTILSSSTRANFSVTQVKKYTITAEQYDNMCGWSGVTSNIFWGGDCGSGGLYRIYPNPANSAINVTEELLDDAKAATFSSSNQSSTMKVQLFTWQGSIALTDEYDSIEKEHQVNISYLPEGRYILHIYRNSKLVHVEQILVER